MIILIIAVVASLNVSEEQLHAQREARMMADRQQVGHFLGCCKGAKFSGVGKSRDPYPKTCYPWEHNSSARKIIADAIIHRDGWYYRSTHWK